MCTSKPEQKYLSLRFAGTLSSELSPAGAAPRLDVVVSETESDSSSSARQGRLRWARSTTERSPVVPNLQQSWTPIKPVVDQHPKAASPLLLSSFGRKLARESPIHRKVMFLVGNNII